MNKRRPELSTSVPVYQAPLSSLITICASSVTMHKFENENIFRDINFNFRRNQKTLKYEVYI